MVWFQVNIPLVLGCLLMAALMDLRVFKLGLLAASILLMFSATGAIVFPTKLGAIPANGVAVLSVWVWLACAASVILRWIRSKRLNETFGSTADRTGTREMALSDGAWMWNPATRSDGAWMWNPATRRVTTQIASEFHLNRLISGPSGSTLYGVLLGEAGWVGPVQLKRLHEQDGRVPAAQTFEPGIVQIAIGPVTEIPSVS